MNYSKERPDFEWLNSDSEVFLKRGYLLPGVKSIDRIRQIADVAEKRLKIEGFSDKFFHYMGRGYFSLSSPIWANYGLNRGYPISCFGSYVGDSISDIMSTLGEVGMMSKIGGGTSAYFGEVRARGSEIKDNGESNGSFSFLKPFETITDVISQGTSRRGQFAGYQDIDHPDVDEWLDIHTEGNPIQSIFYGICVGRQWLQEMKDGDENKRDKWAKILERKLATGIPYLFFKDNANEQKPDVYKDKNMTIWASNMCTEIMLPSSISESFVCCLSSMNLLYYEEWKNTDAVETLTFFLDSVMSEFIDKINSDRKKEIEYATANNLPVPFFYMEKALNFATNHRALGLGVLGWHSYLQSNMIPFDSMEAMRKNYEIFKLLHDKTLNASKELAVLFGEPSLLKGYGRRNTTVMSIAPTKSSSFILGNISPTIQPIKANYIIQDLAKVKSTYKNPMLLKLLIEKDLNIPEIWESILLAGGSVQHLVNELSDLERDVYKTFEEVSQLTIIQQAAQRQQFIDQGQSINIMVHPSTPIKDLNKLYLTAESLGIKSLYYQYSISAAQDFNRELLSCSNCEG